MRKQGMNTRFIDRVLKHVFNFVVFSGHSVVRADLHCREGFPLVLEFPAQDSEVD
jgi:hypothetical protein